jgi:hypothetical protein
VSGLPLRSWGRTVIAGDERAVEKEIARFAAAGVTDFLVSPVGDAQEQARTLASVGRAPR